jgi:hypothetical protein
MRYAFLIVVLGVCLTAQNQPNCNNPITRDVDARCGCVRDPNSDLCEMVKKGFYDGTMKFTPLVPGTTPGLTPTIGRPTPRAATQPARPAKARVVVVAHKDYLRFLQPDAQIVAGFDFGKVFQSPEIMAALFGQTDGEDARNKLLRALKEMDHLWLSVVPPNDVVLLMTGKFEQGVAAGMFYEQGIYPVFLNDAHAMMVGPEPAMQAAFARLARPAAAGGWVTRRARELSKDHETWIVTEMPPSANRNANSLPPIRKFALGIRISGEAGIDGEVIADSDASAEKIGAWVDQMKTTIREKTGVGALDSLNVERTGPTLRFFTKGDALLAGDAGKTAVSSDFGVELYSLIMGGLPGMPTKVVAEDKLLSVKEGMKREDLLKLLGPPLSVSSIQGLETPRETWTYQVPFGKQLSVRIDAGVVTSTPR